MASDHDPSAIDRMLAAAEALLRQRGFTERTIRDRRALIRAQIINHLRASSHSI